MQPGSQQERVILVSSHKNVSSRQHRRCESRRTEQGTPGGSAWRPTDTQRAAARDHRSLGHWQDIAELWVISECVHVRSSSVSSVMSASDRTKNLITRSDSVIRNLTLSMFLCGFGNTSAERVKCVFTSNKTNSGFERGTPRQQLQPVMRVKKKDTHREERYDIHVAVALANPSSCMKPLGGCHKEACAQRHRRWAPCSSQSNARGFAHGSKRDSVGRSTRRRSPESGPTSEPRKEPRMS